MENETNLDWLDENAIATALEGARTADLARQRATLAKARERVPLSLDDVAVLAQVEDPEILDGFFTAAKEIKAAIYGKRIVMFSPLYFSNLCENECRYCAFRASNRELTRRILTLDDIRSEIKALIDMGQKRVLLIGGEDSSEKGFHYLLDAIAASYSVKGDRGAEIRRVNVNVAPLGIDQYRQLEKAGVGTYQLFQETYHRPTYGAVHLKGPKADFAWRTTAMDRAMLGGFGDVGMGVLLGLADWKFDVLAMLQHVRHLEDRFGIGCHTISVPRIEPAVGSQMAAHPPKPVSDADFKKIVALLRLAVPYTGIIMSTRETPAMRRATFSLGVSQISGGSCTAPGGYSATSGEEKAQFERGDHRSLDTVIRDVAESGFIPSFCCACEERGRIGGAFMPLAKDGLIKKHCTPNALLTAAEYAARFATPATQAAVDARIANEVAAMPAAARATLEQSLAKVRAGGRPQPV
jgi:2-iminoacetate synthase